MCRRQAADLREVLEISKDINNNNNRPLHPVYVVYWAVWHAALLIHGQLIGCCRKRRPRGGQVEVKTFSRTQLLLGCTTKIRILNVFSSRALCAGWLPIKLSCVPHAPIVVIKYAWRRGAETSPCSASCTQLLTKICWHVLYPSSKKGAMTSSLYPY